MTALTTAELAEAASSAKRAEGDLPAAIDVRGRVPRPDTKPVISGVVGDAAFHPSPTVHPGRIEGIEGYEELKGYLAPAHNALSVAVTGLEAIANARQQLRKDTSKTEEQKILVVAGAAEKKREQIQRTFDTAHTNLTKAAEAIEQMLTTPLKASAERPGIAAEVRSHFKSLTSEQRGVLLNECMKNGDKETLQIVLGAQAFLSGMSENERAIRTRMFHEQQHPDVMRRLAATRRAIEILEKAAPIAFAQVEDALGAKFSRVAELRGQVTASDNALAMLTAP